MTSLLVLKVLYVLGNFLILSDTLLFTYCSLYVYFEGDLDFTNNFTYITLKRRRCVSQVMPRSWNKCSLSGFEIMEEEGFQGPPVAGRPSLNFLLQALR